MFIIYGTAVTLLQPEFVRLRDVGSNKTEIFFSTDVKRLGIVLSPMSHVLNLLKNNANISLLEIAPEKYVIQSTIDAGVKFTAEETDVCDLVHRVRCLSDEQISYISTSCYKLGTALRDYCKGERSFSSLTDTFSLDTVMSFVNDVHVRFPQSNSKIV